MAYQFDTTDLLPGGKADRVPRRRFSRKLLDEGIAIEMEHTDDRAIAEEIAADHLSEDKGYYRKLKKAEEQFDDGGELVPWWVKSATLIGPHVLKYMMGLGNIGNAAIDVADYTGYGAKPAVRKAKQFIRGVDQGVAAGRKKRPENVRRTLLWKGKPPASVGNLEMPENADELREPDVPAADTESIPPGKTTGKIRKALGKVAKWSQGIKYTPGLGYLGTTISDAMRLAGLYPPKSQGLEYLIDKYQAEEDTKAGPSPWTSAPYIFAEPPPPPKWWHGQQPTRQSGPGEKPPKYPPGHRKAWTEANSLRWFALNAKGKRRDDAEEAELSELNSHPDNWHRQVQDAISRHFTPRQFSDAGREQQFSIDPASLWQLITEHPHAAGWTAAGLFSVYRIVSDTLLAANKDEMESRKKSANEWSPNAIPRRQDNNDHYASRPRSASQDIYAQLARRAGVLT